VKVREGGKNEGPERAKQEEIGSLDNVIKDLSHVM